MFDYESAAAPLSVCLLALVFWATATARPLNDHNAPLRLTFFPGRDDCNPSYRPFEFSNLALVVNCQWSMNNVEQVLANLSATNRRAILSDSFILYRTPADMAVYKKYKHVFAMFYAQVQCHCLRAHFDSDFCVQDEGIYRAVSNGTYLPSEINERIDSPETVQRVDAMIAQISAKIDKLKSITADIDTPESHVPVFVNEAKPILHVYTTITTTSTAATLPTSGQTTLCMQYRRWENTTTSFSRKSGTSLTGMVSTGMTA